MRPALWRRGRTRHLEELRSRRLRRLQICLWRNLGAAHRAPLRDRSHARRHARVRRSRKRPDRPASRQGGAMSETIAMQPLGTTETRHTPTVYFIDDSATMREVIKIAFRRENFNVITCGDAASALAQFEQHPPDVVITDVIMPDQDGYSVCSQIKQSPQFGKTPVILMSGVVNKSVADSAVLVQADELVGKPFQPQELIGRVRNLLNNSKPPAAEQGERLSAPRGLDCLLPPPPSSSRISSVPPMSAAPPALVRAEPKPHESVWPRALAD